MPSCWYDAIRVVVRYIFDGYVTEIHDTDRIGANEHIEDAINRFGLEKIEADVYRDASGGLVVITQEAS